MREPLPKKSLGQHWLRDEPSLEAITEAANIGSEDIVIEVGPGLGLLTKHLCDSAKKVIAIELDRTLATQLKHLVRAGNLEVVNEDILSFDLTKIDGKYKIVANLPYYITSNFIRVISESANPPELAVLLVQKEVAERLNAGPGQMSILGVTAQVYWQVSLGLEVPREFFDPPPKVDSQVVILKRRSEPLFEANLKDLFRIVKAGFSQKRKTLLNSISSGLRLDKAVVKQALDAAGIDEGRRAQTLALEEWHKLYQALN
jgi:16S rRNA (adenine1518-N6/adenine1519-N6)-dimethyltransferase